MKENKHHQHQRIGTNEYRNEILPRQSIQECSGFRDNSGVECGLRVGGFTSPERAATQFVPANVRARGDLIGYQTPEGSLLYGDCCAAQMLRQGVWLSLTRLRSICLAVDPQYQGHGLGRLLMTKALDSIKKIGIHKTVL